MAANTSIDNDLIAAAKDGSIEKARAALAKGAVLLAADELGLTASHWAAHRGDAEMTSLCSDESSAMAQDSLGRTPIHLAGSQGNARAAQALLAIHPACSTGVDLDGNTPLHAAADAGVTDVASLLLAYGASKSYRNAEGQTASQTARSNGFGSLAELIEASPQTDLGSWRASRGQSTSAAFPTPKP